VKETATKTIKQEGNSLCASICGRDEFANPTPKSFIVNQVSSAAEQKRVAQLNRSFEGHKGNSRQSVFCSNFPKATCHKFFTLRNSSLSPSFVSPCKKTPNCLSPWIEQPLHFGALNNFLWHRKLLS